jgi:predicted TIM-barrel fold metal-dependent hydrolase
MITDCHIHIQPLELFKPDALELMKHKRSNFDEIAEYCRSPKAFLNYLDGCGVDRAVLINYVAPEVIGFTPEVNQFVAEYTRHDPKRLISCGSLHPRHTTNIMADVEHILRLGLRMIKIHPPHQLFSPNAYRGELWQLAEIYRECEERRVPVMFHTGTSVFPRARNVFADPMPIDDVAVDFPNLRILLAHSGRPLYGDTAFFLARRHRNVFLEISGIPPKALPKYLPRLGEMSAKVVWGTDWPSPGVNSPKKNVDDFLGLGFGDEVNRRVLRENAEALFASPSSVSTVPPAHR